MPSLTQNNPKLDKTPITPIMTKNKDDLWYPISFEIECYTIWPDIIGHIAIAKFSKASIIPKAVPVIFLLTTTGMEGMMQLA